MALIACDAYHTVSLPHQIKNASIHPHNTQMIFKRNTTKGPNTQNAKLASNAIKGNINYGLISDLARRKRQKTLRPIFVSNWISNAAISTLNSQACYF